MYNIDLENNLISADIVDIMGDYVSVQMDMDSTRIKAAANVAQTIDISRIIGAVNLERVKNPQVTADDALRELVIPAWVYFTYFRVLKMFNGSLTDSGYVVSEDAERGAKQAVKDAEQAYSIAEVYMNLAIDYINAESDDDIDIDETVLTPKIRVFGGGENRGSN
tara:strand:- start:198 stop:692 length:495 start_codon:yes stop_codon:yes gene_type:complete